MYNILNVISIFILVLQNISNLVAIVFQIVVLKFNVMEQVIKVRFFWWKVNSKIFQEK